MSASTSSQHLKRIVQVQRETAERGQMSVIPGFVDYQKREYCRDFPCTIQLLLDQETEGSEKYELSRGICKTNCLHTTHEFHAWLIKHGYQLVRQPG